MDGDIEVWEAILLIVAVKLALLAVAILPFVVLCHLERIVEMTRGLHPRKIWDRLPRIVIRRDVTKDSPAPAEPDFECVVCQDPEAACTEKYYVCLHRCVCAACYATGHASLACCPYCRARKS